MKFLMKFSCQLNCRTAVVSDSMSKGTEVVTSGKAEGRRPLGKEVV